MYIIYSITKAKALMPREQAQQTSECLHTDICYKQKHYMHHHRNVCIQIYVTNKSTICTIIRMFAYRYMLQTKALYAPSCLRKGMYFLYMNGNVPELTHARFQKTEISVPPLY